MLFNLFLTFFSDYSSFQCPHTSCTHRFRISSYFYDILPKTEEGVVDFDLDEWKIKFMDKRDESGEQIWRKNSNPLRNLRKSFTNHYQRVHRVYDIPWCLQTQQQRLQTHAFFQSESSESESSKSESSESESSESESSESESSESSESSSTSNSS